MASNKTANYSLPQWEQDDFIQMDDFNAAFSKIDEKLKANADAASQSVATEAAARAEADANLSANLASLSALLGAGGHNARIAFGSYTGDGTYGSANPVTLTFDFRPVLVLIGSDSHATYAENPTVLLNGWSKAHCDRSNAENADKGCMTLSWGEKSVSFYNTVKALYQCNYSDDLYRYVAIGYNDSENA